MPCAWWISHTCKHQVQTTDIMALVVRNHSNRTCQDSVRSSIRYMYIFNYSFCVGTMVWCMFFWRDLTNQCPVLSVSSRSRTLHRAFWIYQRLPRPIIEEPSIIIVIQDHNKLSVSSNNCNLSLLSLFCIFKFQRLGKCNQRVRIFWSKKLNFWILEVRQFKEKH